MNNMQYGPFGHQLRQVAQASNDEADIRRWNAYAIAQTRKLDAEAAERKRGVSAVAWFYGQSWPIH